MEAPSPAELAWWANVERLRTALLGVAAAVLPADARIMVIRGVHLAFCVASAPWFRWMDDADALVIEGRYSRAVAALRADPRWLVEEGSWSTTVMDRATGACVDLHRTPLPPGLGDLRLDVLRARGRTSEPFGPRVLTPDALDAACIAVGQFVRDGFTVFGRGHLDVDLRQLRGHEGVTPEQVSARLFEHRLRRTGIVAFTALCGRSDEWRPWLQALVPSPREREAAEAAVRAVRGLAGHRYLAAAIPRAFADGVGATVTSLGAYVLVLARDWSRARRKRLFLRFGRGARP